MSEDERIELELEENPDVDIDSILRDHDDFLEQEEAIKIQERGY